MEQKEYREKIIRILSQDIRGGMDVYSGFTQIKGVSWAMSNAICNALGIDKKRKISSLSDEEIKKISDFIKNPKIPRFLLNRSFDFEKGQNLHLVGTSLELQQEFDIKRLKKIKSYRGIRHMLSQPVRGQRTGSHFRKNKTKSVGVRKKTKKLVTPEKK